MTSRHGDGPMGGAGRHGGADETCGTLRHVNGETESRVATPSHTRAVRSPSREAAAQLFHG
eukprot:4967179-Prymnesium_polylepis.1